MPEICWVVLALDKNKSNAVQYIQQSNNFAESSLCTSSVCMSFCSARIQSKRGCGTTIAGPVRLVRGYGAKSTLHFLAFIIVLTVAVLVLRIWCPLIPSWKMSHWSWIFCWLCEPLSHNVIEWWFHLVIFLVSEWTTVFSQVCECYWVLKSRKSQVVMIEMCRLVSCRKTEVKTSCHILPGICGHLSWCVIAIEWL